MCEVYLIVTNTAIKHKYKVRHNMQTSFGIKFRTQIAPETPRR
jgi:hypothetical protein